MMPFAVTQVQTLLLSAGSTVLLSLGLNVPPEIALVFNTPNSPVFGGRSFELTDTPASSEDTSVERVARDHLLAISKPLQKPAQLGCDFIAACLNRRERRLVFVPPRRPRGDDFGSLARNVGAGNAAQVVVQQAQHQVASILLDESRPRLGLPLHHAGLRFLQPPLRRVQLLLLGFQVFFGQAAFVAALVVFVVFALLCFHCGV